MSIQNGLSQNTVTAILKDPQGFMWFGTLNGLNRYDGYNFHVYKNSRDDSTGIGSNVISALYLDKKGDMWVGTNGGGLCLYIRETDSFIFFRSSSDTSTISNDAITAICEDNKGNLWIGTYQGLNLFDPVKREFKRFFHSSGNEECISSNSISSLAADEAGNLWVGTNENGLNYFNTTTFKSRRFIRSSRQSQKDGNDLITVLVVDSRKQLWVGSQGGLSRLDNDQFIDIETMSEADGELRDRSVLSISETDDGKLWVGFENFGLWLFDPKNDQFTRHLSSDEKTRNLDNLSVLTAYEDDAGIMWLGKNGTGITVIDPNENAFAYSTDIPLVNAFAEDHQGTIWIGTDGGGLHNFSRKTRRVTPVDAAFGVKGKVKNDIVVSLLCDDDGNIWSGTYGSGLNFFNVKTKAVHHYKRGDGDKDLNNDMIYALLQDDERIWIGTLGGGINVLDRTNGVIKKYFHNENIPGSMPTNYISAIERDRDGRIWIGTFGSGLVLYNEEGDNFVSYQSHNSGLSSNVLSAVCVDRNNDIWVGTMDGGLNFFDRHRKQFVAFDASDGLASNLISCIEEDGQGHLWLTTSNGISEFNPTTKTFKNFDKDNGLNIFELRPRASLKSRDGELFFGGLNGFMFFRPGSMKSNTRTPPVVITGFRIFNKPALLRPHGPLEKSIFTADEVQLSHDQSVFNFEFAALNYTFPAKNTYAYKLEGFDREWNYTTSIRRATYTNLDPGNYTFRVKASNNDNVWNEQGASIKVIITPPLWDTWWFKSVAALFVLLSGYTLVRIRIDNVKKQKVKLEKQVQNRTTEVLEQKAALEAQAKALKALNEEQQALNEELTAINDELHAKNGSLETLTRELEAQKKEILFEREETEKARREAERATEAKSIFLATMSHEIRTPMNGVLGMASLLAETSLTQEQREYAQTILTCGDTLLAVINDILDFSKIESGNLELEQQPFNLRRCIEGVMDMFSPKAGEKGLELLYHISHDTPSELIGDAHRLRQILINLIGNALKFTDQGEIILRVRLMKKVEEQADLIFEVVDTGVGIDRDKMSGLFKAFSQADASTTRKYGGTGLGLAICRRLVELMHGTIAVESECGAGTTFRFMIKAGIAGGDAEFNLNGRFVGNAGRDILVVDDNATNLAILKDQLEQWKLKVTLASSATDALDLLRSGNRYDLVITDMGMPEVNGVEMAEIIRERYNAPPVILLRCAHDEIKLKDGQVFSSILNKPVKQKELASAIRLGLSPSSAATEVERQSTTKILSKQFAQKHPMRILLVEDNPVNQMLATRTLQKLGYDNIGVADNGSIAIEKLNEQFFDLVLMDVQMPVMDGLEATRIIRGMSVRQPVIIAMTANAMKEDREICLKSGMNDYLTKPFKLEDLVSALERAERSVR